MAENYLEIQRLSYHAKQYQLVMLLVFNCNNHMEVKDIPHIIGMQLSYARHKTKNFKLN